MKIRAHKWLFLALTLSLVAAACGNSTDESSVEQAIGSEQEIATDEVPDTPENDQAEATTTTAEATTTTAEATTTTAEATTTTILGADATLYCVVVLTTELRFLDLSADDLENPDTLEALYTEVVDLFNAAVPPAEIAEDFEVVRDWLSETNDALIAADYDSAAAAGLPVVPDEATQTRFTLFNRQLCS